MGQASSSDGAAAPVDTKGTGPDVYLNIYEPVDETKRGMMGFGIYHSGIEVNQAEYAFGGGSVSASGVYTQTPKTAPPGSQWQFKLSQPLGKSKLDSIQIGKELDKLKKHFAADKYELLTFNCNHFTEAFAQALGVHQNYPSWVNRAAHYGSKLRGIYDPTKAKGAPQPVPEQKSVFQTSKGHVLDETVAKPPGTTANTTITSSTPKGVGSTVSPANVNVLGNTGNQRRRPNNPWADPNFKPPGNNVLDPK